MHRFLLRFFGFHPWFKKQDVSRKTDLLRFKFPYFSNIFPVESKLFSNFSSTNCLFFVSHRSLILFKFPSNFNVCQDHRSLVDGLMMLILLFDEMGSIIMFVWYWKLNHFLINQFLSCQRERFKFECEKIWEMSLNFNICLKFMQFVERFPNYF